MCCIVYFCVIINLEFILSSLFLLADVFLPCPDSLLVTLKDSKEVSFSNNTAIHDHVIHGSC